MIEPWILVTGPTEHRHRRGGPRGNECFVQASAFSDGDDLVTVAVRNQERRGRGMDLTDRAGQAHKAG